MAHDDISAPIAAALAERTKERDEAIRERDTALRLAAWRSTAIIEMESRIAALSALISTYQPVRADITAIGRALGVVK